MIHITISSDSGLQPYMNIRTSESKKSLNACHIFCELQVKSSFGDYSGVKQATCERQNFR